MGTGKSMMTIAITGTLEAEKGVKRMLVVCPKSIVGVWEEEFRKFADYKYALTVLDGTMEKSEHRSTICKGLRSKLSLSTTKAVGGWRVR